jgi:ankyrin repeat protein
VKLLLANDRIDPNLGDEEGDTPLMWAKRSNREAIVKVLLVDDRIDPNLGEEVETSLM